MDEKKNVKKRPASVAIPDTKVTKKATRPTPTSTTTIKVKEEPKSKPKPKPVITEKPKTEESKKKEEPEKKTKRSKSKADFDITTCSETVFYIDPKITKKPIHDLGDIPTKSAIPKERLSDKKEDYSDLQKLMQEGHNFRRILAADSENEFVVSFNHFHDKSCEKECKIMSEEKQSRFATLTHAFLAKEFANDWRNEFTLDSNSDFRLAKNVAMARAAAKDGVYKRAMSKEEKESSQTSDKKRQQVSIQLRPSGREIKKDEKYDEKQKHKWQMYCVKALCDQKPDFKNCLLATKSAVLTNGKTKLGYLMAARDSLLTSAPAEPKSISLEDQIAAINDCLDIKPEVKANTDVNWFGDKEFAVFHQGTLSLAESLLLDAGGPSVAPLIASLKIRLPHCFANNMQARKLSIRSLSETETVWTV